MSKHQPNDWFSLDDLRRQIALLRSMGSIKSIAQHVGNDLSFLSGVEYVDLEVELKRYQGIIDSMTAAERREPHSIDEARRRRIAAGAGVGPLDVSALIGQFDAMAKAVEKMSRRALPVLKTPPAKSRVLSGFRGADRTAPPMNRFNWIALWNIQKRNLLLWDFLADG
jgi:signal recognition particle GTPase